MRGALSSSLSSSSNSCWFVALSFLNLILEPTSDWRLTIQRLNEKRDNTISYLNRYLIRCHTEDLEGFKREYEIRVSPSPPPYLNSIREARAEWRKKGNRSEDLIRAMKTVISEIPQSSMTMAQVYVAETILQHLERISPKVTNTQKTLEVKINLEEMNWSRLLIRQSGTHYEKVKSLPNHILQNYLKRSLKYDWSKTENRQHALQARVRSILYYCDHLINFYFCQNPTANDDYPLPDDTPRPPRPFKKNNPKPEELESSGDEGISDEEFHDANNHFEDVNPPPEVRAAAKFPFPPVAPASTEAPILTEAAALIAASAAAEALNTAAIRTLTAGVLGTPLVGEPLTSAENSPWAPSSSQAEKYSLSERLQFHDIREKYVFSTFYRRLKSKDPLDLVDARFLTVAQERKLHLPYLLLRAAYQPTVERGGPRQVWAKLIKQNFIAERRDVKRMDEDPAPLETKVLDWCTQRLERSKPSLPPYHTDPNRMRMFRADRTFPKNFVSDLLQHFICVLDPSAGDSFKSMHRVLDTLGYGLSAETEFATSILYKPSRFIPGWRDDCKDIPSDPTNCIRAHRLNKDQVDELRSKEWLEHLPPQLAAQYMQLAVKKHTTEKTSASGSGEVVTEEMVTEEGVTEEVVEASDSDSIDSQW